MGRCCRGGEKGRKKEARRARRRYKSIGGVKTPNKKKKTQKKRPNPELTEQRDSGKGVFKPRKHFPQIEPTEQKKLFQDTRDQGRDNKKVTKHP